MTADQTARGRSRAASGPPIENTLTRIRIARPTMAKGAARIADVVLSQPERVVHMSVTELAEAAESSEGSVVNFCRSLGLSGFQQMKLSLAQEIVRPVHFIHEDLEPDDDMDAVCRKVFHSGIQALRDTLSVLDPRAVTQAVGIISGARRVEVYGIGSSAPMAEDAAYRMLRIGLDAKAVTDSHVQAISATRSGPNVAVLTISHTGATHETVTSTKLAKAAGAGTVVVTNYARSPIHAHADVLLYTMARETRFRTEAMASRIAQLCVLDALIAALALKDHDRSTEALRTSSETLAIKRF